MECGVYCENFIMIGLKADAGDNFKKRASIPLAPCIPPPTAQAAVEHIEVCELGKVK